MKAEKHATASHLPPVPSKDIKSSAKRGQMKAQENHSKTKEKCIRLLKGHLGEGGYREFLRNRQPALDDRTGQDLIDHSPELLLERLEMLERGEE